MAPPKSHGRRRQCQVETRVQETEQVYERQARQGERPVRCLRSALPVTLRPDDFAASTVLRCGNRKFSFMSFLFDCSVYPGASRSWKPLVSGATIPPTLSDNALQKKNVLARPISMVVPAPSSACNSLSL